MLANNVKMSLCAFSTWGRDDKPPPCDTCSPPQRRWWALAGPLCGCGSGTAVCWVEVGTGAPCTDRRGLIISNFREHTGKFLLKQSFMLAYPDRLWSLFFWYVSKSSMTRCRNSHSCFGRYPLNSIETRRLRGGREKAGPAGCVEELTY